MPCTGDPPPCEDYGEADCEDCGCSWDFGFERCEGEFPDDCDTHGSQVPCEDCGCDWSEPGIDTVNINVGDVWKDTFEMKINIGDVFKTVNKIQINIGDAWKTVWDLLA